MPSEWHDWHDFYMLLGTSSAALVALLFVAVSIGASFRAPRSAPIFWRWPCCCSSPSIFATPGISFWLSRAELRVKDPIPDAGALFTDAPRKLSRRSSAKAKEPYSTLILASLTIGSHK